MKTYIRVIGHMRKLMGPEVCDEPRALTRRPGAWSVEYESGGWQALSSPSGEVWAVLYRTDDTPA